MATNNSVNYVPTQYNVITGGASGLINNVAPGATSGVPLISQGSSSQPIFGTAAIAGGGTNATSFTQSAGIVVYNGTSLVNYAGPQIDSSGRQTNTSQPAFYAYLTSTASNTTGDGTVISLNSGSIFTIVKDQTSSMATTGIFTAPKAGLYNFFAFISFAGTFTLITQITIMITTTARTFEQDYNFTAGNGPYYIGISVPAVMSANDTAFLKYSANGATKVVGAEGGDPITYFGGYLVC